MSERLGARLRMRYEPKPAGLIEEKDRRGVVLASFDFEFRGGSRRGCGVPIKREKAFVKRAHILAQQLGFVVLRVDGHENHLYILAVVAEEPDRFGQRRQSQRADLRAAGIAEIERDDLAAEFREFMRRAVVSDEVKVPSPVHAGYIGRHQVGSRGLGLPRSERHRHRHRDRGSHGQRERRAHQATALHRKPYCAENCRRVKLPESPPVTTRRAWINSATTSKLGTGRQIRFRCCERSALLMPASVSTGGAESAAESSSVERSVGDQKCRYAA